VGVTKVPITDTTLYEIDTILAAIMQIKREQANLRCMMTAILAALCPEAETPQERDHLDA